MFCGLLPSRPLLMCGGVRVPPPSIAACYRATGSLPSAGAPPCVSWCLPRGSLGIVRGHPGVMVRLPPALVCYAGFLLSGAAMRHASIFLSSAFFFTVFLAPCVSLFRWVCSASWSRSWRGGDEAQKVYSAPRLSYLLAGFTLVCLMRWLFALLAPRSVLVRGGLALGFLLVSLSWVFYSGRCPYGYL